MMSESWISLSEAAKILGVHTSTVRSWADQGRLPVHRTQGGHRRFRREELELCMEAQHADKASEDAGSRAECAGYTCMKIGRRIRAMKLHRK
jgi:excisionase family DNA binding protein